MAASVAHLKHPTTGRTQRAPTGFSWPVAFFLVLIPFFTVMVAETSFRVAYLVFGSLFLVFRGHGKAALIYILFFPALPFIFNRLHIKRLLRKGYKPIEISRTSIPMGWSKPHRILANPFGQLTAVKQGISWPSTFLLGSTGMFLLGVLGGLVEGLLSLVLYLLLVLVVISLFVMANKLRELLLISGGHSRLGIVIETSPEAAIISWLMVIDKENITAPKDKHSEGDEIE